VAAGFEHSIANMYFIPLASFIALDQEFVATIAPGHPVPSVTWAGFLLRNLLPVTIGNVIGGTLLVGLMYWFVYLRRRGT
jgi:formate/nitrite transporter FocA (FNT family)